MSIIRAQGCVLQIEQDIVNDFKKIPSVQNRGKTWDIDTSNSLVSLVAKFKAPYVGVGDQEKKWLAVNIVFPGITVNAYRNAPLLLQPHCSFFMKSGVDVTAALKANSEELPLNFWAMNQRWFDENKFVDVLFGYKEHGWNVILPIVRKGDSKELHYRPTRMFNISEVGWLTDKVIEFIRMWCDV
jgi:hypothetical protein